MSNALTALKDWLRTEIEKAPAVYIRPVYLGVLDKVEQLERNAPAATPAPTPETHKLDTDRQVFFYEQDFYVLSNFSAFRLKWQGFDFDTSEAAYHWEKFPTAPEVRDAIRFAPSAHEAFKVAERYKDVRRRDWDLVKVGLMKAILIEKSLQHEYVRRKLLQTGDRELVEDSWRDDFWGWGPNRNGKNMLGKLWMEIRAELRVPAAPVAGTRPAQEE